MLPVQKGQNLVHEFTYFYQLPIHQQTTSQYLIHSHLLKTEICATLYLQIGHAHSIDSRWVTKTLRFSSISRVLCFQGFS